MVEERRLPASFPGFLALGGIGVGLAIGAMDGHRIAGLVTGWALGGALGWLIYLTVGSRR